MTFKKGQSGNPKGREPGKTPGAKIRAAIEKRANDILQSVINAAVGGDMQAAKMLLDRITPPLKPQAVPVTLMSHNALADQGKEIINATLSGQIPPDIGSQLITALSSQAKIAEFDELTRRIEILENKP
ncbi:MAG: DUF5681 domain-containing protein [Methylococcaceae bacterium]|nr:DUF5681 domain-containing protein [Methylococcaceae bacterium]